MLTTLKLNDSPLLGSEQVVVKTVCKIVRCSTKEKLTLGSELAKRYSINAFIVGSIWIAELAEERFYQFEKKAAQLDLWASTIDFTCLVIAD